MLLVCIHTSRTTRGYRRSERPLGLSNNHHSERLDNSGLKQDIVDFTELVLKNNNFEFDDKHYVQKLGTAIGTRMAPSCANIFMNRLERQLISQAAINPTHGGVSLMTFSLFGRMGKTVSKVSSSTSTMHTEQ